MAVCNSKVKENSTLIFFNRIKLFGWVAQLVEQRTENPKLVFLFRAVL
jgi:hypothetical protein